LALLLLLVACGAPTAAPAGSGEAGAAPSQAILILPEEPATLNQYLAVAAIVKQAADATTGFLVVPNQNGDFIPVLAEEVPSVENGGVSADGTVVTWKLRPDLTWSDGAPLTSDDIRFTWEVTSNPASGAVVSTGFDLINSIETPDAQTAIITYSQPTLAYLSQWTYGLLPRHATGAPEEMIAWEWNRRPVTAGPYVVSEWNSGDSIVMDRNPNYYLEGQPYIDRLIFKVVPDTGAQIAMMAQGEGTVQLWPGEERDVYNSQVEGQATLAETPGQWIMTMFFNLSQPFDGDPGAQPPHPILGDLRVRQAIAHAIDYELITTSVNPETIPTAGAIPYGWYGCGQERLYGYDVEKANALLDEAGWPLGADGIRVAQGADYAPDGTRMTIQLNGYTNFQPLVKLEEALAEMLKQVGIEATIQNDDFSIIFGGWEDNAPRQLGNFDVLVYDTSLPMDPQARIHDEFHSSGIPSEQNPAGDNNSRWVNATADALIDEAGATIDLAERKRLYCELSNEIATDLPRIVLFRFTEGYGASNRLSGYNVNMWGSLTWDVANWQMQ
jgi:peptide/nickel transport system substrate-binding protein